jgi:predicted enzyme related to lactoylglutathione lyase
MGERTQHEPGTFSWADLGTTDADAAKGFYAGLFGWETEGTPIPDDGVYTIARLGGRSAAAMYPAQPGQPPAWMSYVTVEDVDEVTRRAVELGATAVQEPFDVMQAGRMSLLQDPTGAIFALWQPRDSIGAEVVNGHGALSLNQLNTSDPERAQQFYSDLFGWRFQRVEGDTPYWGVYLGDRLNAGMMPLPGESSAPSHWLVYFGIDDIDGAAEQIEGSGGTVTVPKMEIPGGHILVAQDPQGAHFALFAGRFDD